MTSSSSKRVVPKYLECTVVPEQPLLRIRWGSPTHGAVMLYNGEKYGYRNATITPSVADICQVDTSANAGKHLESAHRFFKVIV